MRASVFSSWLGGLLLAVGFSSSHAADHTWAASTGTFDCNAQGVNPGDTITMAAGETSTRKVLTGCAGSSPSPIRVRNNAAGQTTINCVAGGGDTCFDFRNSQWTIVEGVDWSGMAAGAYCGVEDGVESAAGCGIVFRGQTSGSLTQAAVRFIWFRSTAATTAFSNNTLSRVLIEGGAQGTAGSFTGGSCRDDAGATAGLSCIGIQLSGNGTKWNGSNWFEGITVEKTVVRNLGSEGMYLCENYVNTSGQSPRPCRGFTVRYSWVTNTGKEGIQLKNTWQSDGGSDRNKIHDNITDINGWRPGSPRAGIDNTGVNTDIYNNIVRRAGGACIRMSPTQIPTSTQTPGGSVPTGTIARYGAWNNVFDRCGQYNGGTSANRGNGITITGTTSGLSPDFDMAVTAYNNTGRTEHLSGYTCSGSTVCNYALLVAGSPGAQTNGCYNNVSVTSSGPEAITCTGFNSGSNSADVAASQFADIEGGDFCPAVGASFLDNGSATLYSATDINGVSRPQGAGIDRGAYEPSAGVCGASEPPPPPPASGVTISKPSPYDINTMATHYPTHLWVLSEATGSTATDEGSGTDRNLTITGADWVTDALGSALSFVKANSDFAQNTAFSGLSGTLTACAVIRIAAPSGNVADTYFAWGDASSAKQAKSVASSTQGLMRATAYDGTTSITASSDEVMTDGNPNMICIRVSNSSVDVSKNGSPWLTQAGTLSLIADLDTFALGRLTNSSPGSYSTSTIVAAWAYTASKTDAEIAAIFNSGDPWPVIGVIAQPPTPPTPRSPYVKGLRL